MKDCREELHSLLLEDVSHRCFTSVQIIPPPICHSQSEFQRALICCPICFVQRLAGASLLVFANKRDLQGSMTDVEIRDVSVSRLALLIRLKKPNSSGS